MKIQMLGIAALLPVVVLAFSSCSTAPEGKDVQLTPVKAGEPGGVMDATYKETATIKDINKATREITLATKEGAETTVTAGPDVANFDQLAVGDRIKTTLTVHLAVSMRKPGEPAGNDVAASMETAPPGAKPGVKLAGTMEVTATVEAIDLNNRTATLRFPDGTSKTFEVRKDVDLTRRSVGEEVMIRATQALAISVEAP